jgi:zinc and cadmium transporter
VPIFGWIVVTCVAGGVLSALAAGAFALRVNPARVPMLISFAVGTLLGAVFLDILPHLFEETRNPARIAAFILGGILGFFVLEKLLLWRHHHHHEEGEEPGHAPHGDRGRSGYMIVVGDSFHNLTDGVIIASAFVADLRLGAVTALAIIAHEIPQEIGDFLVLLHSGFSRGKALVLNALSGLATLVGALFAYFALASIKGWIPEILAIAAASMIYVAVADLIPGLHKRTAFRETLVQVAFILLGIASIWLIHAAMHTG